MTWQIGRAHRSSGSRRAAWRFRAQASVAVLQTARFAS
jgi:hypothetical protein